MLVCSSDGTVAFFQFEKNEMGDPMSAEEKVTPRGLVYFRSSCIHGQMKNCESVRGVV